MGFLNFFGIKKQSNEVSIYPKIDIDTANYNLVQLYEKYNNVQKHFLIEYNELIKSLIFFDEEIKKNSRTRESLIKFAKEISELREELSNKYGFKFNFNPFLYELEINLNNLLNEKHGNIFNIHDRIKYYFEKNKNILEANDDKLVEKMHSITFEIIKTSKRIDFENEKYNNKKDESIKEIFKKNTKLDDVNRKLEYDIKGLKNHIFEKSKKNNKIVNEIQKIKELKHKYKKEIISDKKISELYFNITKCIESGYCTKEYSEIWYKIYEHFNKEKKLLQEKIENERIEINEFLIFLNNYTRNKERYKVPSYSKNFI